MSNDGPRHAYWISGRTRASAINRARDVTSASWERRRGRHRPRLWTTDRPITPEPPCDKREPASQKREEQRHRTWSIRAVGSQEPSDCVQSEDDHVSETMQCANSLGACCRRNGQPVYEPKRRRHQTSQN